MFFHIMGFVLATDDGSAGQSSFVSYPWMIFCMCAICACMYQCTVSSLLLCHGAGHRKLGGKEREGLLISHVLKLHPTRLRLASSAFFESVIPVVFDNYCLPLEKSCSARHSACSPYVHLRSLP